MFAANPHRILFAAMQHAEKPWKIKRIRADSDIIEGWSLCKNTHKFNRKKLFENRLLFHKVLSKVLKRF
jgi:hypothetical protein